MDQAAIRDMLYVDGATDETLVQHLERLNKEWNDLLAAQPNGMCGVRHRLLSLFLALTCKLFLYFKPKSDDNSVQYFKIPDLPVAIRIWSGGYEEDKNFCLDFFDIRDRTAVNTLDGYIISSVQMPGVDNRWCRLRTVEDAFGLERHHLPPGEVHR
jgi:hypothetical protein